MSSLCRVWCMVWCDVRCVGYECTSSCVSKVLVLWRGVLWCTPMWYTAVHAILQSEINYYFSCLYYI